MGNLNLYFWYTLVFLVLLQGKAFCSITHRVGDLNAWGIPTANPQLYSTWSKNQTLNIGDSLFFLYPPSQDSLIQVTKESYNSCNLTDPILYMDDGNSLFNITRGGEYYFTSGVNGHCSESQKLHVSVYGNGSSEADSPAGGPSSSPYPTVFGSIPAQISATPPSQSSASSSLEIPAFLAAAAAAIFMSRLHFSIC